MQFACFRLRLNRTEVLAQQNVPSLASPISKHRFLGIESSEWILIHNHKVCTDPARKENRRANCIPQKKGTVRSCLMESSYEKRRTMSESFWCGRWNLTNAIGFVVFLISKKREHVNTRAERCVINTKRTKTKRRARYLTIGKMKPTVPEPELSCLHFVTRERV